MTEGERAAAPRPPRRWPLAVAAVVLVIVVVLATCEALGWPFLVGPMQRALSRSLDRQVAFDTGAGPHAVRIHLLGGIRVRADTLEIGAPAWSRQAFMLRASNASVALSYTDLWHEHRGAVLHVQRLQADRLDLKLERLADGRANWQFGAQPQPAAASRGLPTFGLLRVGDGTLSLHDAIEPADLEARFSLHGGVAAAGAPPAASAAASGAGLAASGNGVASAGATASVAGAMAGAASASAATPAGLQLQATGHYRKLPLKIELQTRGDLPQSAAALARTPQSMTLDATVGRSHLKFRGSAIDSLHLEGLRGRFSLSGPSLAAVGDSIGLTLPTTPPFRAAGLVTKDGALWKTVIEEATVGSSRLRGAFTYDHGRTIPLLSGRLEGDKLVAADLGPAVGTAPSRNEPAETPHAPTGKRTAPHDRKVLPDRRFDLPSLRKMDANVLIDIADVDLGTPLLEPLRPLRAHLQLSDGVLLLSDLDARTAEGRLQGNLRLDGRNAQAVWTTNLRLLGLQLQRWIHQARGAGQPPYVAGRLDTQLEVTGQGRSTAEILGSLNGSVRLHVRDGRVSHFAVEVTGIDVANALGILITGDNSLPIACNAADLKVVKGVAQSQVFVIDTSASTIWVSGAISLAHETLNLTVSISPKKFSPFTLRSPIHVGGTFAQPAVSLAAGKLGAQVGSAALLGLLNPLAALLPFIDPGAKADARHEAAECAAVAQRVKAGLARPPAPVRKGGAR